MGRELTVFIVDDDPAMVLLASSVLAYSGEGLVVVGEAHNGASAISAILELKPDLVLCDVMMPGTSGREVVARVHDLRPEQHFVLWSAIPIPDLEQLGSEIGVAYLPKDRIEDLPAALVSTFQVAWPQRDDN